MGKRHWHIAAAIISVWIVCYAAFWLWSSGCFVAFTKACLDAPYEPVRSFVMLDWVWAYQSLIAGALALLAAGAIFLNSDRERQARREEVREQREDQFRSTVLRLRAQVRTASLGAFGTDDINAIEASLNGLDIALLSIADRCPEMSRRMQLFLGYCRLRIASCRESKTAEQRKVLRRAISAILELSGLMLELKRALDDSVDPVLISESSRDDLISWKTIRDIDRTTIGRFLRVES